MITTKGKTFTIERSKWLRGEDEDESYLLRPRDGKMCCLGQVGQQCGLTDDQLANKKALPSVQTNVSIDGLTRESKWGDGLFSTDVAAEMMIVNDVVGTSDEDRESRLSELAQQAGFSLKFVD